MTKEELLSEMNTLGACREATRYVQNHPAATAREIGLTCDRSDWLAWYLDRTDADCQAFAFACADRAIRQYAPAALDRAGLSHHAAALRALAPITNAATANGARVIVYAAATLAAADTAYAATLAASDAAYAAADAADAATRAADAAYAAAGTAATRAAYAAYVAAADAAAERATQLRDLHALWASVFA